MEIKIAIEESHSAPIEKATGGGSGGGGSSSSSRADPHLPRTDSIPSKFA